MHPPNNIKTVKKEFKEEGKGEGLKQKGEKESSPSDGMFSEAYYERTGWNLNNLAASQGSVLKYLQVSHRRLYVCQWSVCFSLTLSISVPQVSVLINGSPIKPMCVLIDLLQKCHV